MSGLSSLMVSLSNHAPLGVEERPTVTCPAFPRPTGRVLRQAQDERGMISPLSKIINLKQQHHTTYFCFNRIASATICGEALCANSISSSCSA